MLTTGPLIGFGRTNGPNEFAPDFCDRGTGLWQNKGLTVCVLQTPYIPKPYRDNTVALEAPCLQVPTALTPQNIEDQPN